MQRVVSINLNGNAYELEETGYNALFAYLDAAEVQVKDHPNRAAILSDLERKVAEKCDARLGPHKSVVTAAEVDQIIAELGPPASQSPADEAAGQAGGASSTGSSTSTGAGDETRREVHGHRRLYQIREGSMISGVCAGLAAYFNIDVSIVRIVFVLLAIVTQGAWILAYFVLMVVVPRAETRDRAVGATGSGAPAPHKWPWDDGWPWDKHGWPWDRYGRPWDHPREARRRWRRERRAARMGAYGPGPAFGAVMVVSLLFAFLWLAFWTRGRLGGPVFWGFPFFWGFGFPHWIGIIFFLIFLRFLFLPFRLTRWGWYGHPGYGPYGPYLHPYSPWLAMWHTFAWFAMTIFIAWAAYHYIPEVRDFIRSLQTSWSDGGFRV